MRATSAAAAIGTTLSLFAPAGTESAVANGDTRTLTLLHAHTHEALTSTYMRDGVYDPAELEKLNWELRDWRRDEPIKMDPRLFDTVWEVYREVGSHQPIRIMSAYRSPETNAMLRRRSSAVAEHSQHMLGKAMDVHFEDVGMSRVREVGMRLQHGGVGYYPTAGSPFVHLDVGGVRHWPRMGYDQLARLFPDGKTVHIPSNGQPLARYEEARAELEATGGIRYPTAEQTRSKGLFAWLFGGGEDEEEEGGGRATRVAAVGKGRRGAPTPANAPIVVASAASSSGNEDGGSRTFFGARVTPTQAAAPTTPTRVATPAPPVDPSPAPAPTPVPAAVPTPPPAPTPVVVASVQPSAPVEDATRAAGALVWQSGAIAAAPMPPRRPSEFAVASLADLDTPMPPSRPVEFMPRVAQTPIAQQIAQANPARDPIGAVIDQNARSGLPEGASAGRVAPAGTLGFAASGVIAPIRTAALALRPTSSLDQSAVATRPDVPEPVRRPVDFVAARLDRSNFRSLTATTISASRATTQSVLGSGVTGLRPAARMSAGTFVAAAPSGLSLAFGRQASDLRTDSFTGPAVKGLAKLD